VEDGEGVVVKVEKSKFRLVWFSFNLVWFSFNLVWFSVKLAGSRV